jgi:hypothetical protein
VKSALLLLAATALLVSHPVAAQSKPAAQAKSIAGTWNATVKLPNGGGSPTLTFAVKGDSVSGSVKRASGETFPLKGTIKGKDLTYSYSVPAESQQILVTVKAKVMGDSLSGTMDFGGQATGELTAKRAKSP